MNFAASESHRMQTKENEYLEKGLRMAINL